MYRIMTIDEEYVTLSTIRNFINLYLAPQITVEVYESSPDALSAFELCPADLVLTDIRMPFIDGLELIEVNLPMPKKPWNEVAFIIY